MSDLVPAYLSPSQACQQIKLGICVRETGSHVHAPPPYNTGIFLHYPTSPGVSASIMPLTLLSWITLSIWAETTVLTLKDVFKPLPSSVKNSLDLWFLLSYIGFLTKQECIAGPADHRYRDRLSTVSNGDIKSGLGDLLSKGKLTRAGDNPSPRPPPSTSPPLASPPPPVRQRPSPPSSTDAQRVKWRKDVYRKKGEVHLTVSTASI